MAADHFEKPFVGGPVEQVLAGMQFEAGVDAAFLVRVENGTPAPAELLEGRADQIGRTRRPGIKVGPRERAGEGHMRS